MTLVELVTVFAVLVILAGVVLGMFGTVGEGARRDLATVSLMRVREACLGTASAPGFAVDLGETPARIADLFVSPPTLSSGRAVLKFDPYSHRGWNGPYLQTQIVPYVVDPSNGFTTDYGIADDPSLADPWGRPIVLQRPRGPLITTETAEEYARIISAGPNGRLDTPIDFLAPDIGVDADVGDDIVVYLHRANGP